VKDEIVRLEERPRAAQLAADVAELDTLIADELLFAGPDGALAVHGKLVEGTYRYMRVWAREGGAVARGGGTGGGDPLKPAPKYLVVRNC
jgi:hypothetical protein